MDPTPDRLDVDLHAPEFVHGVEQLFWEFVERTGNIVFVRMIAPDQRSYLAKLTCNAYGEDPIDCKFVDKDTRQCVESAWPRGNGIFEQWIKFKVPHLFVCWDQDADGLKHHSEWGARKAWKKPMNQLVAYLNFLRELLHVPARGYERQSTSERN